MKVSVRRVVSLFLIALCFLLSARRSRAEEIGLSKGQATGLVVAMVAVAAGIVVVTYFVVRKPRTVGCVVDSGDGLVLQSSKGDQRVYKLSGGNGALKAGERVKVVGRRKGPDGQKIIYVSGVAKDYGACPAH